MIDYLIYSLRGKRVSKTLDEDSFYDILKLWQMRIVTIKAKGKSIAEIYVDVKNRLDRPIKVLISPGTYFNSQGSHQNMAIRKEMVFLLNPLGSRFLNIPACCINADRPIPGNMDSFKGVKRESPNVVKFLRESQSYSPMVVQAGVWALTDGYNRNQIKNRLVNISSDGRSRKTITDIEIDSAKNILDRLEIQSSLT